MTVSTKLMSAMMAISTLTLGGVVLSVHAATKPTQQATVAFPEARNIALKARPGTITDEELEKESGGSGLRYSFDIKNGSRTYEVGVDAKTGKVLENILEGKNPD